MLKLFYYCLNMDETAERFVAESLFELSDFLKKPPVRVRLKVDRLPEKYRQNELVCSPYSGPLPFTTWCKRIGTKLLKKYPLLVYCKPDSKIAQAAQKECNLACWGLTNDYYMVSAVYKPENKYILWHEVVHLFGVVDCYNPEHPHAGTTCELSYCLMQYAPQKGTVSEWPFLCQKNIKLIQNWSKDDRVDVKYSD
jgi:hypothetical protein